jgi:CarD family transcriptional regulator
MHGAGIIEQIEEQKILDKTRTYYVMRIPFGDMKIMIPVDNVDGIGVRDVAHPEMFDKVIGVLEMGHTRLNENWNKRYTHNMEKLKSGDILQVAEVVRNLTITDREKKLSTGERKMLSNARQILISEMMCSKNIGFDDANEMIYNAVFGHKAHA